MEDMVRLLLGSLVLRLMVKSLMESLEEFPAKNVVIFMCGFMLIDLNPEQDGARFPFSNSLPLYLISYYFYMHGL